MDSIYNEQNIVDDFDKINNITSPPYKTPKDMNKNEQVPLYSTEFECSVVETGNYIERYNNLVKSRANNCT